MEDSIVVPVKIYDNIVGKAKSLAIILNNSKNKKHMHESCKFALIDNDGNCMWLG